VLLLAGGPVLAIAVNGLSFGLATALVPTLKVRSKPSDVSDGGRAGLLRQVVDGFRAVQLHSGSSGYGYLLAGLGVGGVAGGAVVNRLAARTRLASAILGGMAVFCLPTALLIFVHQPAVGLVDNQPAGALEVVSGATLAITALQRSAPKEMVAARSAPTWPGQPTT
jgi:hypothetical protein